MSLNPAIDQPQVRRFEVESPPEPSLLASARRRVLKGIEQALTDWTIRRALHLDATDPEGLIRHIIRSRGTYAALSRPNLSLAQADAMRISGPHGTLPAPPTPAEWFAPLRGEPRGFVLYVHGGSFMAERSPRITSLIGRFAAAANARVYSPSYRLAPEHPCPAAIEDIEAAFAWLSRTWPDEPVVGVGESAGAAILLAAAQRMKARGEAMPRGLMLLSPWIDLSLQGRSMALASLSGVATREMHSMALIARLYLRDLSATDPVASPLFGDMAGLPPMLIHASRSDMLYDDAVRLADKVRDANGDLTLRLWTEENHVWERTSVPAARQSIQLGAEFIRERLAR
jgi:acetyl esterase/lipase